jgi:hypothetical protein
MRTRPQIDLEPDVYRSAWNLIRAHGKKAEREAAKLQEQMIAKGDVKAVSMFWSIHKAIKELRRTKRQDHEPLN